MQIETESRKSVTAFDIRAETRRRGVAGRGPILLIGVGVLIAMVLIAVVWRLDRPVSLAVAQLSHVLLCLKSAFASGPSTI